ncbi:MAG TPA: prolyl oligopeptidase family serine peptidase [Gemmatimonadaceae bacterium]|nr:prolyl oligopeptidase family serine peptidase [Gemmatimonadaceae bacterium]
MPRRPRARPWLAVALTTIAFVALPVQAQSGAAGTRTGATNAQEGWNPEEVLRAEKYVRPPAVVERIITAPRTDISFDTPSPDRQWFLRAQMPDRGTIADYGKPHLYLAGVAIDPNANRARQLTMRGATSLVLVNPRTQAARTIAAPAGATITGQAWSPNGSQVAYIANFPTASHLYVADAATGRSTQLTRTPLLATLVTSLDWTADGRSIVTVLVPDGRGPAPTHGPNGIEDGPQVRLTEGRRIPQRMHWSLLEDPHDQALLKYHTTGQVALVDVRSRAVRKIGVPAMIRAVDVSPDGQYLRVTQLVEPFSYRVPASSFGTVEALWDLSGKVVAELGRQPLREGEVGVGDDPPAFGRGGGQGAASDTGRRNIQWNPVGPGLVYLESVFPSGGSGAPTAGRAGRAGGRGGAAQRQPSSVRFVNWVPPYGPGDTKVLYEGTGRLSGVAFSADGGTMFVNDSTVFAVRTAEPGRRFPLGRGVTMSGGGGGFGGRGGGRGGAAGGGDSTALGGALAMKRGANGQPVVVVGSDNRSVFLAGTRAPGANWTREAPRPWVDKLDFESGQRTRVFESATDAYQEFVTALDDDYSQYIYTSESPSVIADAYLRDVRAGTSTKITSNQDVAPEVTGAHRKRFQVTRPRDGLKFWVEVTLPREWRPGTRLPGIIWFYPREYTTHAEYDRSKFGTNINRFPEVPAARPATATKIWVTQGYAFIEPDSPILGDTGRMNDNYTQDLRETLDAVVDAVVDSGFVDRDRMGLGGHSYGAFSTVNAMTLVPYFKAGIAGDGMYNRTLTPFGFQSERRSFFEAQDTYLDMSPFLRADKLSGALLLYHATEDQNVGTAPISSIRMLHALQGLGKTAALYMYPYEDHSVATYESDLDMWARWFAWFDIYVKNGTKEQRTVVP